MILHTALHGVETNDNPLNISVGYISAESSGFSRTVSDWSESEGTIPPLWSPQCQCP